jgi:hypothetical protein
VARKRQIILMRAVENAKPGEMEPIGSIKEVVRDLAPFNTAPDGSGPDGLGERLGMAMLYGPGFVAEVPTGNDEISQIMVSVTDEDFAWSVLMRMCRGAGLKMMDPETGRTFG